MSQYIFISLIGVLPLTGVYIGYRMGKAVRTIEVKENQTIRYLEEPSYVEEEASVPGED